VCSIAATISPWSAGFPVLWSSTVTAIPDSLTANQRERTPN
jgi:hypothetical protein